MKNIYEFSTELRELFDYRFTQNEYKELIDNMIYYGSRGLCNKSKRVSAIVYPNGLYEIATNSPPEPFICSNNEQCKKACSQICIHAEERAMLKALQRCGEIDSCLCLHLKIVDGKPVTSGNPSCVTCSRKLLECKIKYMYLWQENGWKRWTAEEFHESTLNHLQLITEKQCSNQQELFKKHLKDSTNTIQNWPIWKQHILGETKNEKSPREKLQETLEKARKEYELLLDWMKKYMILTKYSNEELEKFLKENNICFYLYDKRLYLYLDENIPIHNMLTLCAIVNYYYKDIKFSTPFTYGNPFLLIQWSGIR